MPQDVSDAIFSLVNDADSTKRALFSLSGITTATTRTFTLPNTLSELAILAGTQTFSGTLTASGTVTVSAASAILGHVAIKTGADLFAVPLGKLRRHEGAHIADARKDTGRMPGMLDRPQEDEPAPFLTCAVPRRGLEQPEHETQQDQRSGNAQHRAPCDGTRQGIAT